MSSALLTSSSSPLFLNVVTRARRYTVITSRSSIDCATFVEGYDKRKGGVKEMIEGYWLDVLVGPHVAWGVECSRRDGSGSDGLEEEEKKVREELFRIVNRGTGAAQYRHHSVEVTMYNVVFFH